jgi:hypothetical protein
MPTGKSRRVCFVDTRRFTYLPRGDAEDLPIPNIGIMGRVMPACLAGLPQTGSESPMYKRQLSAALVLGMAATAPPAAAQQMHCGHRDAVASRLQNHFNERQTGVGLQSATRLLEVWTSDDTGSWTILVTLPGGRSCVMASGHTWLDGKTVAPDQGTPN